MGQKYLMTKKHKPNDSWKESRKNQEVEINWNWKEGLEDKGTQINRDWKECPDS